MTFFEATWDGGSTYVRDIEVRSSGSWVRATAPDHRFDEQWVILASGTPLNPAYYYNGAQAHWVSFDALRQLNGRMVELRRSQPGAFDLVVRWTLDGANPEVHYRLTAHATQHYLVGYQSVDIGTDADAREVLCGSLQHARVIGGPASLGAWELFAPMSLVQRERAGTVLTTGVYVPGDVIAFEHPRDLGPSHQPFGMSLRNDEAEVQPVVYAPQAGARSLLEAGQSAGYAFGVLAFAGALYDAYVDVCRTDFGLRAYRENVFDTSLTQTAFNIMDLVGIDPDRDDSEVFQPSFSGWWNRAKGFIDVENDQAVRTAVAGVLLSAQYLTCPPGQANDFYQRRSRPMIEYHVSRRNYGSTPIIGKDVYNVATITSWGLGGVAQDSCTLVPLYRQTFQQNAGLHRLAMGVIKDPPSRDSRTPMSTQLEAYRLTGDPAWLAEAVAVASRYARTQIDTPYTTNQPEGAFGFNYSKAWLELFVLYEMTRDKQFLDSAHREAKRFITQTMIRKVPDGQIKVPNTTPILNQFDDWNGHALPDYPRDAVKPATVPDWYVSTSGTTFEQLTTYKSADVANPGGGLVMNPIWAPFLLRLAYYTGDDLIADVSHNLVVGRFTNYPGYYYRQFTAAHMAPDFPLVGPPGESCIYFHHAPAQLGLTLDYLFSEHLVRSKEQIKFPSEFECDFVYFKFSTYGHAPGTFYGEKGVWPYLPAGSVTLDAPQVNWLSGVGNDSLYLSLTNESRDSQSATLRFDQDATGIDPNRNYQAEIIADNGPRRTVTLGNARLEVDISGRGITAVIVRGAGQPAPWHRTPPERDRSTTSYAFDNIDGSDTGIVRGMLLMRPDGSGADAYIQSASLEQATLRYSINGSTETTIADKPYPNEWTIPLGHAADTVRYVVDTKAGSSPPRTLAFPANLTGKFPDGELGYGVIDVQATASPGDQLTVHARIYASDQALSDIRFVWTLPDGWQISPAKDNPTDVGAEKMAEWSFTLTIPAAADGAKTIRAQLKTGQGDLGLPPTTVEVFAPVRITALDVDPAEVDPGEPCTLTVSVLNRGPIPSNATVTLASNTPWQLPTSELQFSLPARTEQQRSVVASAPDSITRDTRYYFSARIGDGPKTATSVLVTDPDTVVLTNHDYYPQFVQTGTWLTSGLSGVDGQNSLYSPLGETGMTATWRPDLQDAGTYEVAVWYPSNNETSTRAVYVVHHRDGDSEFVVNQQQQPRTWRVLGQFDFGAGSDGYTRLEVRVADGYTRCSGARFHKLS